MALQISTEDPWTGFVAAEAYWYVAEHRAPYLSGAPAPPVAIVMRAYKDVAARDAGKQPFVALDVSIPGEDLLTIMAAESYTDLRAAVYDWLKANVASFGGATDV